MNQSAEATDWPLSRVRLSAGSVPRMLTRSPWPNRRSMVTPGIMVIASATLVEGNLPTSSAVITSTIASELRLVSSACCRLARMPVTTTRSSSLACVGAVSVVAASCACACAETPRHTAIAADSMEVRYFMTVLSLRKMGVAAAAGRGVRRPVAGPCVRRSAARGPGSGQARIRAPVFVASLVEVPAGGADRAQLSVLDQGHGNAQQGFAHRSLVEEALHEAAAGEEAADLRQDPASQVDTAAGAV